jgi:hypothetical protein
MQNVVKRLIAEEREAAHDSDHGSRAAFRVCEKLRPPLSAVAGVKGFRSLLSRARVLAQAEAPLLEGMLINPDGSFEYSPAMEERLATKEAAKAGAALAGELLGLLVTFIGEGLTLRLVHDIWPGAAVEDSKIEEK